MKAAIKVSIQMIYLLILSVFAVSCSDHSRAGIDPLPSHQAAATITESFQVQKRNTLSESDLQVDQAHVVLNKSALNKEFLLSTNLLSQTPTPMFKSLQSRVVSFILRDQKVYMLDVTKNNSIAFDSNIPQNLLIAEFPVLQNTETNLAIDFNAGMKQILTVTDMYGSDDSTSTGADYQLPTAQVKISYLDEVSLRQNALFIKQVAQLEVVSADQKTEAQPVEVRYQIKPYNPNPNFVPTKSPGFDKVGYFEANPLLLKDGSTRVYAMKWDTSRKIKFAVSANTPAKYRELAKNSLLYWNKILGENAIEVVQLEDKTISAPDFDLNILQWADWDSAGYAFADAHVDPRSGEVTSAQIFFPSAFIQANVAKRVRLTSGSRPVFGLKGFTSARLCQRDLNKDLSQMETAPVSAEAMDKAMRDYVYEVIAHELGHVLGLRHNFAGNLAANYDFKDRKNLILSYYQNMKSPEGIVDSSSVMEYSRFEESAWNGDQFQHGGKALAYDDMAMRYLYFNQALPETNRPVFCTDSHIAVYADCNMSDAGRSVVSSATGTYQFNLDSLAARLVNLYISKSKLADSEGLDLVPVAEVNLDPKSVVKTLGQDLAKFVSLLKKGTKLIAVRSEKLPVLSPNLAVVENLEKQYLANEVERLGGLPALLKEIPENFEVLLTQKFSALLNDPLYNSGGLPNGQTYSFTEAEKEIMKSQVQLFAAQVKTEFILNEIKALSGVNFSFEATYGQSAAEEKINWADSTLTEQLAGLLQNRFELYAISKTIDKVKTDIPLKDGSHLQIELPLYKYPQNIRVAAADLFSNGHEAVEWGFLEKQAIAEDVENEISILGDVDKIEMSKLNKNTLKWYLNNKQLESALPN